MMEPSESALREMPFLMSEDFAVLLGLKKSEYGLEYKSELERLSVFKSIYLPRNLLEPEEQQDVVWSRFCAIYLPATVDRFLNLPAVDSSDPNVLADHELHNVYCEMLVHVQHSPYFAKYLRSKEPAAAKAITLPRVVAQRLAERAPRWDRLMVRPPPGAPSDYYVGIATNACQLLSTLCTFFLKHPNQEEILPTETKVILKPFFQRWAARYNQDVLADICLRTLLWFEGGDTNAALRREYNSVRRSFKNWDVCGYLRCDSRSNLQVCSRCHTVRYCSSAHQALHWKDPFAPHKNHCFTSEY